MRSRGLLFCLIPPILWGGMLPVADSIAATVDSFSMTLIRYTAAAVVLAVLLARAEGLRAFRLDGRGWRLALLGASGFAGFGLLAFSGAGGVDVRVGGIESTRELSMLSLDAMVGGGGRGCGVGST